MSHRIRLFLPAAFLIVVTLVFSLSVLAAQEAEVPPQLQPPVDQQLLVQVHAKGDQIYACKSESAQFNWTLKAPDAQLFTPTTSTRKSVPYSADYFFYGPK
jgi:hypothetical protein